MPVPSAIYRPSRRPQDSDYYHCVEDYFETFMQEYDDHFSRQYGFWRPYMENLARYIIRASFSQERMRYLEQDGTVVYRSKDGKDQKTFPVSLNRRKIQRPSGKIGRV